MTATVARSADSKPSPASGERHSLVLRVENDSIANQDRYYTHSTRLDFGFKPGTEPAWLQWMQDRAHGAARTARRRAAGLFVEQNIFTGKHIDPSDPPPADRPFAGWLLAGVSLMDVPDPRWANHVSVSLGVVGPMAQAEAVQKFFHWAIGAGRPRGWERQLENEPTLDLLFERIHRPGGTPPPGAGFDALALFGANAGNVFLQVRAGLAARAGYNLPDDFGPTPGRPARVATPARDGAAPPRFRAYAFAAVEARGVARNLFLDGNTFRDGPSVSRLPVVEDLTVGISAALRDRCSITFSYLWRTHEFKSQDLSQGFGSLSVELRY